MARSRGLGLVFAGAFIVLSHSPAVLAWQTSSVESSAVQNESVDFSDANSILTVAVPRTMQNRRTSMAFTYGIEHQNRNYTPGGKLLVDYSAKYEVIFVGDLPYRRLVEEDHRPLKGTAAVQEQERFDRTFAERNRMSLAEKRNYLRRPWNVDFPLPQLLPYFSNRVAGEELMNGRSAVIVESIPRPDVDPVDEEGRRALHKQLKLWIDRRDLVVSRIEATLVADDGAMRKGTVAKIDFFKKEGVWLPAQSDVQFEAVKGDQVVRGETKEINSDFRRFRVDVRLIEPRETAGEAPGAQ